MSDDGWEQASVSKSFITGDGCAGQAAHQTPTRARRCQSWPIPSVSHLTQRFWNSDGRLWHWGGTEGEIRAYPNKLISTISACFLLMDPWSSPKVWLCTVVTRTTSRRLIGSCFCKKKKWSWSRWCCSTRLLQWCEQRFKLGTFQVFFFFLSVLNVFPDGQT